MILEDYNKTLEQDVSERTLALEIEIQERKRAEMLAKRAELALRQANQKLESLATLDGLTQISNRRRFDEFLQHTWLMTMRDGREMSVILCDVDYFKNYNDTYGHQAGDVCLQQVAKAIQKTVQRSGDLVARYGGEEFVIVLANTDAEGAVSLAERVKSAIASLKILHSTSDVSSYVTISMGICTMVPKLTVLPESLVSCADKSLYLAKRHGRNCIKHYQKLFFRDSKPC
ncbi:MAG: GGDEF domain-containing protein [Cyanobacteria bacterium]|nr:GGDEF domain-containing protein [Cyanobacteriota bacterium]